MCSKPASQPNNIFKFAVRFPLTLIETRLCLQTYIASFVCLPSLTALEIGTQTGDITNQIGKQFLPSTTSVKKHKTKKLYKQHLHNLSHCLLLHLQL